MSRLFPINMSPSFDSGGAGPELAAALQCEMYYSDRVPPRVVLLRAPWRAVACPDCAVKNGKLGKFM